MNDIREELIAPTKELIEKLEEIKEYLTYEQRAKLSLLKLHLEMYEEEKARNRKLKEKFQEERRKHDL